jgi:hypothetical protein
MRPSVCQADEPTPQRRDASSGFPLVYCSRSITVWVIDRGGEGASGAGRTTDELAGALDDIDRALRGELPEIAEVFIDLTTHRAGGVSTIRRDNRHALRASSISITP